MFNAHEHTVITCTSSSPASLQAQLLSFFGPVPAMAPLRWEEGGFSLLPALLRDAGDRVEGRYDSCSHRVQIMLLPTSQSFESFRAPGCVSFIPVKHLLPGCHRSSSSSATASQRRGCPAMQARDGEDDSTIQRPGSDERRKAMQEKLAKWKEEAELARLRDPDSAVTRAAKMFESGENEFLSETSPRGMAVNRMVKLKDSERRYEISSDLRKRRLEELSMSGSNLQEMKSETQEQFEQFSDSYGPPPGIEELEEAALGRRPTNKITSKLEVWRKAAEDARSKDVRRLMFDFLTATFYGVAFVIGWILRKPIDLSPRAGTPKVVDPGELLEMRMNMRGSAEYYQVMADEVALLSCSCCFLVTCWAGKHLPAKQAEVKLGEEIPAAIVSPAQEQVILSGTPVDRLTSMSCRMIALIAEDDGQGIDELLRDSVDSPEVESSFHHVQGMTRSWQDYQTLLGFSDSPSFLPLAIAIKQSRRTAVEVSQPQGEGDFDVSSTGPLEGRQQREGRGRLWSLHARAGKGGRGR
eukprot:754978-Hanusia_phi.AAC.5